MLSDLMTAIPPIVHSTTATANDVAAVIVGLLIAFALLAMVILAIAARQSAQKQSQMKETRQYNETLPQPESEQPSVHASEGKVLLPR